MSALDPAARDRRVVRNRYRILLSSGPIRKTEAVSGFRSYLCGRPIRGLSDKRLYVTGDPKRFSALSGLIGGRINLKIIREHWDEILRLAASIKQGSVTASLMLRKLGSYPRQNRLSVALRELGRVGWDADVAAHVARVLRRLRLPPRPAAAPLVWLAEYVARTRQEVPELLAKLGDHAAHMYAASLMRERQLLAVAWSLASMGLVGHDVVKAALSVPVGDAPVLTHVKQYVPVAAV